MECNKFKNKPTEEKIKKVKEQRLCWNCLSKGHVLKDYKSQHRCKVSGCNKQHYTLIHREKTPETSTKKLATSEVNRNHLSSVISCYCFPQKKFSQCSRIFRFRVRFHFNSHKFQLSGKEQNLVLLNVMCMSNKIRSKLVSFSVSPPSHPDPFKMTKYGQLSYRSRKETLKI